MRLSSRFLSLVAASGLGVALTGGPLLADAPRVSKDVGPASAACDRHEKGSAAWSACVGKATAQLGDDQLFYAGYWLAKNGQYQQALDYLARAQKKDEKVLTYMGFATRKLGDVDAALPLYRKALEINPDYTVARAYLGEAFLTKGEPAKARAELAEIAQRCGTACPTYVDLEGHIRDYEAARKG